MATHITGWLEESSDYELFATLVGEDGTTALDPGVVTELTATLRDEITGVKLWDKANVLNQNGGALQPLPERNFTLQLTPAQTLSLSAHRYQKRILTLSVVHSEGKRHNEEISFTVEDLRDIGSLAAAAAARGR
jgi:hypothetical protein